jgi:hypothetical protein
MYLLVFLREAAPRPRQVSGKNLKGGYPQRAFWTLSARRSFLRRLLAEACT